jgi:predicted nuclease with TOPRIM domain
MEVRMKEENKTFINPYKDFTNLEEIIELTKDDSATNDISAVLTEEDLDELSTLLDYYRFFKSKQYYLDYYSNLEEDFKNYEYHKNKTNSELREVFDNANWNYNIQLFRACQNIIENAKEDLYTYHQLLRAQNQREYRSKFLKDFQKDYGSTDVFPDYDEIYKRYDKLKKENKKLQKAYDKLITSHTRIVRKLKELEDTLEYTEALKNSAEEVRHEDNN